MEQEHGNLSINSENIFPLIKKWLYSDHDIFFRELISYGCDAITKLKKLSLMGEYELPEDYKPDIKVSVSSKEKTITFTDNGLGMTKEQCEAILKKDRSDSKGIGVKNVNDRLKIYFGDEYGISIDSELDVGTTVTIRIPKIEKGRENEY